MQFFGAPRDIKHHVDRYITSRRAEFTGKTVVDVPAGSGIASAALLAVGAEVLAFDLFPEFCQVDGIACMHCDLNDRIPLADHAADHLICQEGLEHLPDQLHVLREFNRVLKPDGTLLITTPNYSNLKNKLSYLLTESEYVHKIMPPNEVDDIWFSDRGEKLYLGHLFLTGAQRLRVLARLSGFTIQRLHRNRVSGTAFALFCLLYPALYVANRITLARSLRKKRGHPHREQIEAIYRELVRLNLAPTVLTCTHLFVEFRKTDGVGEASFAHFQKYDDPGFIT